MTERSLADWLRYAESVHLSEIEMGLDRVRRVAQNLGLLPWPTRAVIVAGTNGKGSTCLALEHTAQLAGLRVGTTLSPHLSRFNERVRLDGTEADDAQLCAAFAAVEQARGDIPLTYFEFSILVALQTFLQAAVELVILEVGLGGRLDACNIVDADVAVITSIGLDHQEFLGDSLDTIGAEKAGVLRTGQLAVLGADLPDSVWQRAQALGCQIHAYGQDFEALTTSYADGLWRFALAGPAVAGSQALAELSELNWTAYQPPHNASLALVAATLLGVPVHSVASLQRPLPALAGRMQSIQWRGRHWLLDVAHNPAASQFLHAVLQRADVEPSIAIVGQLANREVSELLAPWSFTSWVAVATSGPRGQSADDLLRRAGTPWQASGHAAQDAAEAVELACASCSPGSTILVFGSFAVVEAVRDHLHPSGTGPT